MVPRSAEWDRVVPGGDGADIREPLNYATTKGGAPEDGLWSTRGRLRFVVPRSAEECRGVPSEIEYWEGVGQTLGCL